MVRFQFSLRALFILTTLAAVVMSYVGSYYHLSRRGMREAEVYHLEGFFYTPIEEALATQDLSTHNFCVWLFAPLNWVDQKAFGGSPPSACLLWELTRRDG